ncbi:hypothetical protein F5J12DRAFT_354003 [Pisolithus orientalis]|uniref:uncharacterized protein n=1 Tax=Pisolithus orientalis TaxID=936130 RepID=UPI002224C6D6|nr:uncharacterized protein F5J12DRAFT_354003 [Pisolithus orientalis]KAI5996430.1 hypothetical protein F5J12DRAFT_354003 [Pisolithus orientalis]
MGIPGGFGSILIGGLIATMLYGITTLQGYVYFMHYSEDGLTMKFLVAATWFFDTLHVSLVCHMLYYYLITNYGVPTSLEYLVWPFPASILVNSVVVSAVQCFFAYKIYHLCRSQLKWLVTAAIILFVLAHFVFGVETAALILADNAFSSVSQIRFYSIIPSVASLALAEVLITVSLCVLFYEGGSRSTIRSTKRLLNTLIIYAVNRCLLTLLVAVAEVVTVSMTYCTMTILLSHFLQDAEAQDAWSIGMDFIIGKLYANSLLASLNTRQYLRSQDSLIESDQRISTVRFANLPELSDDVESSKDGGKHIDVREAAVINISAGPARGKTTAL